MDDERLKMTLKDLKIHFSNGLEHLYSKEEIHSFFYLLTEHRMGFSKLDITLQPDYRVEDNDLDFFLNAFAELEQERPIQYYIGTTEFYGVSFKVSKDVLIPRPETEELVAWILSDIEEKGKPTTQNSKLKILDIGTGTGCIAISLAKHLSKATVYALDVSEKALQIAKENAQLNEVEVNFIQQDILNTNVILSDSEESPRFDIIVSNPPYVRELEKHEIKQNVLANEPHLALFVNDENPLVFYDRIADLAKQLLKPNGLLFFEINQYLSEETLVLLEQHGFTKSELKKDLFGNFRMIKASKSTLD